MTRTRYRFGEDHYPHFMTCTVVAWLPVFSQPCFTEVIYDSWRFLQREREITILAYVILENHLHWIAVGPQLGKRVGEFKSYTATTILQRMKEKRYMTLLQELSYDKLRHKVDQTYQLWQEGSHPQCLESIEVLRQKIDYTHSNPMRRGYVDDPLHWRYSSAGNYAGQAGLIEVCTDWQ
jgi:REP element-mobilizing transposase RayT